MQRTTRLSPIPVSRRKKDQPRAVPERLAYRVDTLAEIYDVSRELIYRAIRDRKLDARRLGACTLVTAESARRFLGELPPWQPETETV